MTATSKYRWTIVAVDILENEINFLEESVFSKKDLASNLPQSNITARTRYSLRAEIISSK